MKKIAKAIEDHIAYIAANSSMDLGVYLHIAKHPPGIKWSYMNDSMIAARVLEHMGFMNDADIDIVDHNIYRIIDMFRKIPRNLSDNEHYYNKFIDNYDPAVAKHGTVVKRHIVKLVGKSGFETAIKELNAVSCAILTVPHVRDKLITAILRTDTRQREMTRVCSLFNYVSALHHKPTIDSYKFVVFNKKTRAWGAIITATELTGTVLRDFFGVQNEIVTGFLVELATKLKSVIALCDPPIIVDTPVAAVMAVSFTFEETGDSGGTAPRGRGFGAFTRGRGTGTGTGTGSGSDSSWWRK